MEPSENTMPVFGVLKTIYPSFITSFPSIFNLAI
jgi:hypothetical protein